MRIDLVGCVHSAYERAFYALLHVKGSRRRLYAEARKSLVDLRASVLCQRFIEPYAEWSCVDFTIVRSKWSFERNTFLAVGSTLSTRSSRHCKPLPTTQRLGKAWDLRLKVKRMYLFTRRKQYALIVKTQERHWRQGCTDFRMKIKKKRSRSKFTARCFCKSTYSFTFYSFPNRFDTII